MKNSIIPIGILVLVMSALYFTKHNAERKEVTQQLILNESGEQHSFTNSVHLEGLHLRPTVQ